MKRYLTLTIVVLTVLALSWAVFGQQEGKPAQPSGKGRGSMSSEEQLKAIEAVEQQVAKLKAGIQAQASKPPVSSQDLSEEEKAKLKEQFTKAREERQAAIKAILAQLVRLQGQTQPLAEGEQFIIVNTADLKAVQALAEKEKAKETADRVAALLQPPRRGGGSRPAGQPSQPSEKGTKQKPAEKPGTGAPKKPD